MLCFLREKSHEMPGGQGYSAPAWAYPHLLIHYSVAEEFTEGVGSELACPGKGKTDLFSARSASLQHEAKRRAWVVPGSIGFLSTGRGGQDALTSGRKCVAPGRGLEVAGQTVRPSAEHGRPKVRLKSEGPAQVIIVSISPSHPAILARTERISISSGVSSKRSSSFRAMEKLKTSRRVICTGGRMKVGSVSLKPLRAPPLRRVREALPGSLPAPLRQPAPDHSRGRSQVFGLWQSRTRLRASPLRPLRA